MSARDDTLEVVTFGCRLNSYESAVIQENARAAGLSDAVIVNTCAVTAEAERQARQAIRRLRRQRPGAKIIVTGCAAQIDPARFSAMPEVNHVLGNEEKMVAESFNFAAHPEPVRVNDIMEVTETAPHMIDGFHDRSRAFVQVQQGCDHRCTFCIIPFGRGNSRSVPMGAVVDQVRRLCAQGINEVVLTGVDITSYGGDLPGKPSLGQMMRRLLALVPELPRLRLSSLDAVEIDPDLYRLLAEEPRLMPHLHLSLQAGDDLILKRMKRRHLRADALRLVAAVRAARPDVVFGADLIAGFPTETEAMFQNSLDLVRETDLTYLHVFPYSERPGTPAARMPAVPPALRKERAARLRDLGQRQLHRFLTAQVGQQAQVLVEKPGLGRSAHFAPVRLDSDAVGSIQPAIITGVADDSLIGAPLPEHGKAPSGSRENAA